MSRGRDSKVQAKYTFFEAATQHGYIVALMAPRMSKSREFYRIVIDRERGRVFQLYKVSRPDAPVFEFIIPERDTTESTLMWREKAKRGLDKAWKEYQRTKVEQKEARSGAATPGPSSSTPSKIESSSTDARPNLVFLPSESAEGASDPPAFGLVPSTPASSKTVETSSKGSGRPSRKSGSRSRSSSGASTVSSG